MHWSNLIIVLPSFHGNGTAFSPPHIIYVIPKSILYGPLGNPKVQPIRGLMSSLWLTGSLRSPKGQWEIGLGLTATSNYVAKKFFLQHIVFSRLQYEHDLSVFAQQSECCPHSTKCLYQHAFLSPALDWMCEQKGWSLKWPSPTFNSHIQPELFFDLRTEMLISLLIFCEL